MPVESLPSPPLGAVYRNLSHGYGRWRRQLLLQCHIDWFGIAGLDQGKGEIMFNCYDLARPRRKQRTG